MLPAFLLNTKLEQLQIIVLKQWHDLSQAFTFLKNKFLLLLSKYIFKAPLNGFYDLESMIHVVCIFAEVAV